MSIKLCDGKYEFRLDATATLISYRNGAPWRDFIGDKAVHALYDHALELQAHKAELIETLTECMQFGDVEGEAQKLLERLKATP